MAKRANKPFTLLVSFATLEDVVNFASALQPVGVSIYWADALDPEYGGHAPKNSLVLRRDNHKPDDMRVA